MCEAKECVLTADCTTKDSVRNSGQTAETNTLADKHTELQRLSKQNIEGLTQQQQRCHMTRIISYKRKCALSFPLACMPKHPKWKEATARVQNNVLVANNLVIKDAVRKRGTNTGT